MPKIHDELTTALQELQAQRAPLRDRAVPLALVLEFSKQLVSKATEMQRARDVFGGSVQIVKFEEVLAALEAANS